MHWVTRTTPRVALVAVLGTVGCGLAEPYDRSNPFDPGSPYSMRIVGAPDTVYARGDRFQVTIERDPPLNPLPSRLQWEATDLNDSYTPVPTLTMLFQGDYMVNDKVTAEYRQMGIGAYFNDEVTVGRTVIVGQRTEQLSLTCGTVAVPAACDAAPTSLGAFVNVRSAGLDANGYPVRGLEFAIERAEVTLRTPGVLQDFVQPNPSGIYQFQAIGSGSTWVVIRVDRGVDSVRVEVP